jgi:hypothetical protein
MRKNRRNTFHLRNTWMIVGLLSVIIMIAGAACVQIPRASAGSSSDSVNEIGPSDNDGISAPGFEDSDPARVQECLDQGGIWTVLGIAGEGCNLPTEDGGKTCSGWADCESLCLANDDMLYNEDTTGFLQPDHEIIEQRNVESDQFRGVCSAWQSNFGCHVVLENGKYVVICID